MFRFAGAPFRDRREAGRLLAAALSDLKQRPDVLVVALPRGGVPVAYEVAEALDVPLAALIVRKLGAPGNPELAIGALASDGTKVIDHELIAQLGIRGDYVQQEIERQRAEIARRLTGYGLNLFVPEVEGRTVIVVDDGVATGSTVEAALRALRQRKPRALILAVPVGSADVMARLEELADRVVTVRRPEMVFGVGAWYVDFSQTPDEEVLRLLQARAETGRGDQPPPGSPPTPEAPAEEEEEEERAEDRTVAPDNDAPGEAHQSGDDRQANGDGQEPGKESR